MNLFELRSVAINAAVGITVPHIASFLTGTEYWRKFTRNSQKLERASRRRVIGKGKKEVIRKTPQSWPLYILGRSRSHNRHRPCGALTEKVMDDPNRENGRFVANTRSRRSHRKRTKPCDGSIWRHGVLGFHPVCWDVAQGSPDRCNHEPCR